MKIDSYYTTITTTDNTYGYNYIDYKPLKRKKIDYDTIDWTTGTYTHPGEKVVPLKPKEESKEDVKKLFDKKILVKLKDGITIEITYGELYEIEKTGRVIEELTVEELKELLVMLKL